MKIQHCPEGWEHAAHAFLFCGEPRWCLGGMQFTQPTHLTN